MGSIRRVICGSPAYFSKRGTPQSPGELSRHDCVTFEGLMPSDTWMMTMGKSENAVPIHSRLVVNTAEAAIDAAIAGVGITRVLSYQIADAIKAGALAVVLEKFEPAPSPLSLIYAGVRLLPVKLRAFLDFAAPRLKARLLQGMTYRARSNLQPHTGALGQKRTCAVQRAMSALCQKRHTA
ncbi:MAG: LysR substrate-binding domain-containing protein [Pseudolabrys sp.]